MVYASGRQVGNRSGLPSDHLPVDPDRSAAVQKGQLIVRHTGSIDQHGFAVVPGEDIDRLLAAARDKASPGLSCSQGQGLEGICKGTIAARGIRTIDKDDGRGAQSKESVRRRQRQVESQHAADESGFIGQDGPGPEVFGGLEEPLVDRRGPGQADTLFNTADLKARPRLRNRRPGETRDRHDGENGQDSAPANGGAMGANIHAAC